MQGRSSKQAKPLALLAIIPREQLFKQQRWPSALRLTQTPPASPPHFGCPTLLSFIQHQQSPTKSQQLSCPPEPLPHLSQLLVAQRLERPNHPKKASNISRRSLLTQTAPASPPASGCSAPCAAQSSSNRKASTKSLTLPPRLNRSRISPSFRKPIAFGIHPTPAVVRKKPTHELQLVRSPKALPHLPQLLVAQRLERRGVNHALAFGQNVQRGCFSNGRLAGARGCAHHDCAAVKCVRQVQQLDKGRAWAVVG